MEPDCGPSAPIRHTPNSRGPEQRCFRLRSQIWEIALKFRLRRKDSPPFDGEDAVRHFTNVGYDFLNVNVAHAAAVGNLDTAHPDPFDRLLIAQAITEPLILVTRDSKIAAYSPTFITW